MDVRFLLPAEVEMLDAAIFYDQQVTNLGANFLSVIENAIGELREHPQAWPDIGEGVRKRPVRRFPYSVLYQIDGNEIISSR